MHTETVEETIEQQLQEVEQGVNVNFEYELLDRTLTTTIRFPRSWVCIYLDEHWCSTAPTSAPLTADAQAWHKRPSPDGTHIKITAAARSHCVSSSDSLDSLLTEYEAESDNFMLFIPQLWIMQNASAIRRKADLQVTRLASLSKRKNRPFVRCLQRLPGALARLQSGLERLDHLVCEKLLTSQVVYRLILATNAQPRSMSSLCCLITCLSPGMHFTKWVDLAVVMDPV